jgi:hypothetical protein
METKYYKKRNKISQKKDKQNITKKEEEEEKKKKRKQKKGKSWNINVRRHTHIQGWRGQGWGQKCQNSMIKSI